MKRTLEEAGLDAQFYFADNDEEQYKGISRFSKNLWSSNDSIEDITSDLLSEYKEAHPIRYANTEVDYYNVLKIIVCNCFFTHFLKRPQIVISLSKGNYSLTQKRYSPVPFSYRIFENLIKWLSEEQDYITLYVAPNNPNSKRASIIKPNPSLLGLIPRYEIRYSHIGYHPNSEPIFYKVNKILQNYEDTPEMIQRREILQHYNKQLNSQMITIKDEPIPQGSINLICVYNDAPNQGGRIFHGAWMDCPKEDRSTIKINGKETIEVDIVTCSIRIAQHLDGCDVPYIDMYRIHGFSRELIKKIANIMFNIKTKTPIQGCSRTALAIYSEYTKGGQTSPYSSEDIREAVNITYNYYRLSVKDWLFCGRGLELQHWDSKVCFKVIEHFLNADKVVLTIHDSYIVAVDDLDFLKATIISSYEEVIGYKPVLSH